MATQVGIFLLAICSFAYCDANFLDYQPIKMGIYPNNGQRTSFGRCQEGEEQRRGSFVFRCQGGNLVPSACIMQDGNQIPIGGTSIQNSFVTACQQGNGNSIATKIVGCVDDMGQQVQANSVFQWQGGQYRCIVNPNGGAEIQPTGFDQPVY
uniref:Abnormal cell migration protein 18-like fibronectin type I domain-containing protein n=1 Tax=Romanomermis culicivorax TaxID=13658 RepID=A0A915K9T2_ROMCU